MAKACHFWLQIPWDSHQTVIISSGYKADQAVFL